MSVILLFGIILIIFSLLPIKKKSQYWGLIIAFIIMGFQEGVKGDFMVYQSDWMIFTRNTSAELRTADTDILWQAIYHYLAPIMPFWFFILLISAFECWVLWKVGECYGSKSYGWLGPILFFFTFSMMLLQMKAIRQGLAVELSVLSYYLATKKKGWLWCPIFLIMAVLIHNSAAVVVPFILIQLIFRNNQNEGDNRLDCKGYLNFVIPATITALYFFVYAIKDAGLTTWLEQIALLSGDDFRLSVYLIKDQDFIGDVQIPFLLILYNGIMVYLCTWFMLHTDRRYRIMSIASIIACFGEMILVGIGSLPRIMMFFLIYNIYTYPKITELISKKYGQIYSWIFIVFLVGYAMKTSLYWMYLTTDDRFGTYHFVFW